MRRIDENLLAVIVLPRWISKFKPAEDDSRDVVSSAKKQNATERTAEGRIYRTESPQPVLNQQWNSIENCQHEYSTPNGKKEREL